MFRVPPIFELIRNQANTEWKEMYQVFNMGHRLEIYVDESNAASIIDISNKFNIDAKIIGHCETSDSASVEITTAHGTFEFLNQ